jgi:translin
MSQLEGEIDTISDSLTLRQKRFDEVMNKSRELVRCAGVLITKLHNDDVAGAKKGLADAEKLSKELAKYTDFEYNTKQSQQEYSEAKIFFTIKVSKRIPTQKEVGVDGEAYLMGMMDVFGELKREIIGSLSNGDLKSARFYHSIMVEMFDATRSVRFAEAVLQGFRRKQDVARIQMESSSSELLAFANKSGRR